MKNNKLNAHEKKAARAIKEEYNWIVGGIYNSWQDGYEEDIPTLQEAKEMVYEEAMSNHEKEIRFAGEQFCREYVEKLFEEDEDVQEITWTEEEEEIEMTNKKEMLKSMTVKQLREEAKAQGITGMSRAKKEELIAALMFHNWGQPDPDYTTEPASKRFKVKLYTFTGMFIGEYEAEADEEHILVDTKNKGELMFSRETGKEITDAKKARYANRVERA